MYISLSNDAYFLLKDYYEAFEIRLATDLKDIGGWAGKLVVNILRISSLITRLETLNIMHFYIFRQIKNEVLEKLILADIQRITSFVKENAKEFIEMISNKSKQDSDKLLKSSRKELETAKERIDKLDNIIIHLYEDNVEGKILDDRFKKLTDAYETEQASLTERIKKLEATINTTNEEFTNIESFIKLVKKYTNIEKLDCEILRTFVDKVLVYQVDRIDGKKVQKIKIIYNFIGNINK